MAKTARKVREEMPAETQRAELAQRNAEHGTLFSMIVDEAQAFDLASGYVPTAVRAMVMTMLDWQDEDRRRAERPVKR